MHISASAPAAPHWPAPAAESPLRATVTVPGSKSLTNRYLLLAAIADAPSRLRAPLRSRDSELMANALRQLGARIDEVSGDGEFGADWDVYPANVAPQHHNGGGVSNSNEIPSGETKRTVDCGLAGTVMRFVPPAAALLTGATSFDGDPHARNRPMSTIIESLRGLGIAIDDGGAGALPFTVHGTGLVRGGSVRIDASASSQFVSALLLAAPRFRDGLELEHVGGPIPSLPHIDMTVSILRGLGITVEDSTPDVWRVEPGTIPGFDLRIEQDLSNAGPFLAAALVTGGTVRMPNWPENTTQAGDAWRQILPRFGAAVTLDGAVLEVQGGNRITGVDLDLSAAGELAPTVAALAALADGPSRLRGIAHLRGHETDRLAALKSEINALGGDVTETDDGLSINPAPLHGGTFHTYEDHRMATAGAILGLAVPGVVVENIETTAKTMPEFVRLWHSMIDSRDS